MGTGWSAAFYRPPSVPEEEIEEEFEGLFAGVIREMSNWEEESLINCFNRGQPGRVFRISAAFARVLESALELARLTGGAFNPCLGAYTPGLEFGTGQAGFLVDRSARWKELEWRADRRELVQPGGVALDLSAIAKGYAVDVMAAALQRRGIYSFLVEIGGEFRGCGVKADLTPWWVSLAGPVAGREDYVAALSGLAVAGSGAGQRILRGADGAYVHIIAQQEARRRDALAQVTVFHEKCMLADGWATALFALGAGAGMALAREQDLAALFQDAEGAAIHSPRLERMLSEQD